jgi:hypothetical protein
MGYSASQKQAKAIKNQAAYESQVYGINAELAEAQAVDAVARGAEAAGRHRARTRQVIGSQRAGLAAQGVDIGDGSAADVQADAATLGELDALTIENNAKREAWGYKVQASEYRNQSKLVRRGGRAMASAARMQGYSTLLTGGAQIADTWDRHILDRRSR